MPLYIQCALCGRKQADGLLSRGHWGHLDLVDGSALWACPTCKEQNADWEARLRALGGPTASREPSFGGGFGTSYGIAR
jgi:hypothetical protein